jgi:hypothetical protein
MRCDAISADGHIELIWLASSGRKVIRDNAAKLYRLG